MNIAEKALSQVTKDCANAKDGIMKHLGEIYTLKFDRYQGVYVVSTPEGFFLNINRHKLSLAKKVLKEYLEN